MCQTRRLRFARITRRSFLAASAFLATLAFPGCSPSSENTAPAPSGNAATNAAPPAGDFKVALVTSGPISDNGWNAGAYKALEAVRKELNLNEENSPVVENKTSPGEQEEQLRAFASKGFDIVFAHGAEYEDMALKLEKDFPKTLFVVSSGRKVGSNTQPVILHLEDGAYLLGILAGGMTKTNKVASIGGEAFVPVKSVFAAFEAGAKAQNPDITIVPPVYTGSWSDVGKAKQQTLALIDQGADIIMQNVDSAAAGVFEAVKERKDKGVYALGTNSNQNDAAPDVILASAPIYQEKAFVMIAKQVKDGAFKPNDTPFGMKEGVIDFILNPQLEAKIPADLKQKLEETKKAIEDGSFTVPKAGS